VPAVHRAGITDEKQHPVRIPVSDTGTRAVFILGKWIIQFILLDYQFFGRRERLPENRIILVVIHIDKGEVIGSNIERKFIDRFLELFPLLPVKADPEHLFEYGNIPDRMPDLPPPVLPVLRNFFRFNGLPDDHLIIVSLSSLIMSFKDGHDLLYGAFYLSSYIFHRMQGTGRFLPVFLSFQGIGFYIHEISNPY
jgi:hypothetical protein